LDSAQEGTTIPVALTATALERAGAEQSRSVVLVMEDLTELISAQRAAAWSEVARRMAHEIKNPLTPIQLSAERIAKYFHRSYNGNGGANESSGSNGNGAKEASGSNGGAAAVGTADNARIASVVDECTQTITREVAGLKAMVDEFSRFARLPI
jgi:nitrogen fixation/metabolism regulation signal transduction histidine kinase